jgi:hypothetical protein
MLPAQDGHESPVGSVVMKLFETVCVPALVVSVYCSFVPQLPEVQG